MHKRNIGLGFAVLASFVLSGAASAQAGEGTLQFDSARGLNAKDVRSADVSARFFSDDSPTFYGSFIYTWGTGDNTDWQIRFSGGKNDEFTSGGPTIRTGGTDVEVILRHAVPSYPGLLTTLGVSLPHTRANKIPSLTASAVYEHLLGGNSSFYLGAKAYAGTSVSLVGLGAGYSTGLGRGLTLGIDGLFILEGRNTFDTDNGSLKREMIYGFVLRYEQSDRITYELVATNSLGSTTAFSMTPKLGDTPGIGLGVKVRF